MLDLKNGDVSRRGFATGLTGIFLAGSATLSAGAAKAGCKVFDKERKGRLAAQDPLPMQMGEHFVGIIDIYAENDAISLAEAKRLGVTAVWSQVSWGLTRDDGLYKMRKTEAQALGLLWGAYHGLTDEGVDRQLDHLYNLEDGSDGTTAIAIDVETPPGCEQHNQIKKAGLVKFVVNFRERYGFYPMYYGNMQGFLRAGYRKNEKLDPVFSRCPLWWVQYNSKINSPVIPKSLKDYTLWQFDDEKRIYGSPYANKKVLPGADFSKFTGTSDDLAKAWPFRWA